LRSNYQSPKNAKVILQTDVLKWWNEIYKRSRRHCKREKETEEGKENGTKRELSSGGCFYKRLNVYDGSRDWRVS